jgi:hypothetical protein
MPCTSWSSSDSSGTQSTVDESDYGDFLSSESAKNQVRNLMDKLSTRGVGNHTCPYRGICKKGGWKNGGSVVFRQNSAFKGHLQKHQKPFKCDLPGCTNKSGFARLDQLQRHKEKVQHH